MKVLLIDCINGISGDMFLGGLLSAGLDEAFLREKLGSLHLSNWNLQVTDKSVNGIICKDVTVESDESHPHRNLAEIIGIINSSGLDIEEKTLAIKIFDKLARAEAKVHGMSLEDIHFHEVGAIDAIVDICSAVIGLLWFSPDKVYCSALPLGAGYVDCMHGRIPIPAPATLELLKGIPIYDNGSIGELVTPTGAAIVSSIVDEFGVKPSMIIENAGYGCGKKRFDIPNVTRLMFGVEDDNLQNSKYESDTVVKIETCIDDMTPELIAAVMEEVRANHAIDAWTQAIHMKKNRTGLIITILCYEDKMNGLMEILFKATTTFGVRINRENRMKLARKIVSVPTMYGTIRAKIGIVDGNSIKAVPEYEDCFKAARENSVAVSRVYDEAKFSLTKEDFMI